MFVDGWTGKGAIAGELRRSLGDRFLGFTPALAVVADPAGQADIAATTDDYLIASGLLGSIVSGLVSRSILSGATVAPGEFHACVTYPQYASHDLSRAFVDHVFETAKSRAIAAIDHQPQHRAQLRDACAAMLTDIMQRSGATDPNLIKPGIAEATRVFLRRVPDRLFVRDQGDPDVAHLLHLADRAGVRVEGLPPASSYRAVAVIGRRP